MLMQKIKKQNTSWKGANMPYVTHGVFKSISLPSYLSAVKRVQQVWWTNAC